MDVIVVAFLSMLVLVLGAIALRGSTRSGAPSGPNLEQLVAEVRLANQQALHAALETLGDRAAKDRAETIETVTKLVVNQSGEALGARAEVLDSTLKGVQADITARMSALNEELSKWREASQGQFESVTGAVNQLAQRTQSLNEVLSSSQKRGQWGERLAEDMLRAAGFVENVNYSKQDRNEEGGRPDFTFKMPPDRVLFMDVKFPLDAYLAHLNAENDEARTVKRGEFVAAVKRHVTALARRDYIDKTLDDALDYVLMFVPNESISGFVHESEPTLIDWALGQKVILCSPLTLYAFLVVIRQATDSFHTEQTAASIMQQIRKFDKELGNYVKAVDTVRDSLSKVNKQFDDIATDGTRFRKLKVPIKEIERQRTRQGIPELEEPAPSDEIDVLDESSD